jgi:hypothetical protein
VETQVKGVEHGRSAKGVWACSSRTARKAMVKEGEPRIFNPKSKGDMSTSQLCWWMNHQYLKQQTDLFIEEKCNDDNGGERIARWRRGNHEGASSVEDPFSTSNCE